MPSNNGISDQKQGGPGNAPLDKAHQSGNREGPLNDGGKSQHSDGSEQGNQNEGTNNQTGSTRGGSFEHYLTVFTAIFTFYWMTMNVRLAEAVRFELTKGCPLLVFKTSAIDHSATLPNSIYHKLKGCSLKPFGQATPYPEG